MLHQVQNHGLIKSFKSRNGQKLKGQLVAMYCLPQEVVLRLDNNLQELETTR